MPLSRVYNLSDQKGFCSHATLNGRSCEDAQGKTRRDATRVVAWQKQTATVLLRCTLTQVGLHPIMQLDGLANSHQFSIVQEYNKREEEEKSRNK